MMITLYQKREFRYPIIAECINPDIFAGKRLEEIAELKIWEGNKQKKLGELFKIEETQREDSSESEVISVNGNLNKVRKIGTGMKSGEIRIFGNVGIRLGEEMKGGKIIVHGNVGGWAGSMMEGGTIEIHGNAGEYLGAPYRGSAEGIRGGRIVVYGNAEGDVGAYMRKGIIKVYGTAGQFVGFRMRYGTIYVQGDCGDRAGACMKDGTIIVGGFIESVLPTFTVDSLKKKVKVEEGEVVEAPLYLFIGDLTEDGRGKLYVSKEKNPHLSHYEKFLI